MLRKILLNAPLDALTFIAAYNKAALFHFLSFLELSVDKKKLKLLVFCEGRNFFFKYYLDQQKKLSDSVFVFLALSIFFRSLTIYATFKPNFYASLWR